ncbi:MAG TPA: hybrid sensor histidine kinase/response regulator [Kofleriaceae bacterium]|nr:hybrid sensor histidine kinase/response regulator [Kofleriaceae bacterium]
MFTSGETEWCENLRMLVARQVPSEETYVTIALAPILDDAGTIEGVAGACLDVTAKVIADRRLALLHKIAVGLAAVRSLDVAAKTLTHILRNAPDVAFATLYAVDGGVAQARVWIGTNTETSGLPAIADRGSILGPVLETEEAIEVTIGDGSQRALALPVRAPGDRLAGILVCGLNPLAPLDAMYRAFLETIAQNVGATFVDAGAVRGVATPAPQLRTTDAFLAVLGHELRNPLGALMTTLQTMMLRAPSLEVELMERSVRTLTRMVDNVLDVSRIARGGLELRPTPTELATIVDRAMQLVTPLVTERNTQVFVQIPRTGLRCNVDSERVAQAIAGLLSNASRYSDPGSRVWVQAAREYDRARIIIKDEGSGIEPDRLAEIFGAAYVATEKRPRNAGLGLGLVIARSLVELHGGSLNVASPGMGRGTEAVIELPIDARIATSGPVANAPGSRRRLLLVEDNDDAARSLKNALELLGYVVALAHNGPIALNVARTFDPDVVLLDIGLPVMDGWELAKRLRELAGATHDAPVVAVTAYDRDIDKQRSTDAGFADHLVKPIDLGKLQEVVESLPMRPSPAS